ncbi:hypothetical protein [Streptomyces sp. NPDC050738]|uniref:hypothetical protein n=1 Tax=Streptomyces sp. NPDC050738 TaxID=3154744 RepID=UPI0034495B77
MGIHREDLYPDLTAAGGLGPALEEAARLRGCDIGLPPWAIDAVVLETARGFVSVDPAAEERLFRVVVRIIGYTEDGFVWRIGSTRDLGLLVEALAAWQEGVQLDELRSRFDFMELDEFARAVESGEPTALQWSGLLSTEFHRRQWNLLRRFHADEVLGNMFPSITHGAVRLRVDPLDGTSRQVLVHELDGERYEVVRVGVPDAVWTEVQTGDLIAFVRTALRPQ